MYPSIIKKHRIADFIVHLIGLAATIIGGTALLLNISAIQSPSVVIAVAIYLPCVAISFLASLAYHFLPQHDWRVPLRRIDHAAIYPFIAGTFTPLLIYIGTDYSHYILIAVWALAIPALLYKIFGSQIEPKWSLWSYLGLGWMGLIALPDFIEYLPKAALIAICCGGASYTIGTFFYTRKTMAYRYATWHFFGFLGGASFFTAIWISLV